MHLLGGSTEQPDCVHEVSSMVKRQLPFLTGLQPARPPRRHTRSAPHSALRFRDPHHTTGTTGKVPTHFSRSFSSMRSLNL